MSISHGPRFCLDNLHDDELLYTTGCSAKRALPLLKARRNACVGVASFCSLWHASVLCCSANESSVDISSGCGCFMLPCCLCMPVLCCLPAQAQPRLAVHVVWNACMI